MTRPTPGELETRSAPVAHATVAVEGRRLRGVIPYGVESRDLNGWREVIAPGALAEADLSDLVATVDHAGVPLARYPGTLTVEDRDDGFHWALDLPESRSDVREAVERGDLCAGSWRMYVARDTWDGPVRTVHAIRALRDVSVVTTAAYPAAPVELRSAPDAAHTPITEDPAMTDPTPDPAPAPAGGLALEDRAAAATGGTPEARMLDAIAAVPRGEARDLTRATASPVEPDDIRTVLIDRFRESSVIAASGVPIFATDKGKLTFPVLTGDVGVSWVDELEKIPESDPVFDDFEVPIKALKALVRSSSEAVEDSDPALLQILADNITTAMALRGDREMVAGNDPKGFKGLLNLADTQSLAVGGALSWDHVVRAVGLLVEANVPGPYAVLMGPRPAVALDLLKDEAGSNRYVGRPDGIPPVYTAGTIPVSGGAAPTTTAIVYAPAQLAIVVRSGAVVEVDRSQEFDHDAVLTRGRYRLGFGTAHPQAVVKLTGVAAPPIAG